MTREDERGYFSRGCEALKNYCSTASLKPTRTIGTEVYVAFVVELNGTKIRLGCKADRLALHSDGDLEIVDYKTTRSGKVPHQLCRIGLFTDDAFDRGRGDCADCIYYSLDRAGRDGERYAECELDQMAWAFRLAWAFDLRFAATAGQCHAVSELRQTENAGKAQMSALRSAVRRK